MFYLREIIRAAVRRRDNGRPGALLRVAPGAPGEKGDLAGREAVARRVVEIEVLQFVGTDDVFSALRGLARHEFGRNLRREYVVKHRDRVGAEARIARAPANEVLDERLGHGAVDVVMRHLVADAIGAPAEREFRQIAGADHDGAMAVGEPEKERAARAGLHVFIGRVVDLLAARGRMIDIGKHPPAGVGNVDFLRRDAERAHQPPGAVFRALRSGEGGQRIGENVLSRQRE